MTKTIRIGPFDYRIVTLPKDSPDHGDCDSAKLTIGLSAEFPSPKLEAETTIHEITHAIYRLMGLQPKDSEERIVAAMSTGWAMVIRDNQALFKDIIGKLK